MNRIIDISTARVYGVALMAFVVLVSAGVAFAQTTTDSGVPPVVAETDVLETPEVANDDGEEAGALAATTTEEQFSFASGTTDEDEAGTGATSTEPEAGALAEEESVSSSTEEVAPVEESTTVDSGTTTTANESELSTDKDDYHPGDTATIFGRFFAPLTSFMVKVFGSDENSQNYTETTDEVTTDDTGSFSFAYVLDSLYRPFYEVVVSTLQGDKVAETWFRDAAVGTYDQCANDDGDGYTTGDIGCRWINGNINGNNSTYQEGDATVQRLWLEGFVPGSSHTVTFTYGTTKQGTHAYDYLTTYDYSENWITLADRCQDITGCESATETTHAIPQDPNAEGFDNFVRNMTLRGGTITDVSVPGLSGGAYGGGDSETDITVTFTVGPDTGSMCSTKKVQGNDVTSCAIALWFGAHIAKTDEWTPIDGFGGATDIPGSPYHVALASLDSESIGERDNQMQASAIVIPSTGTIIVDKVTLPAADPQSFSFTAGGTGYSDFSLTDAADPNSQELEAGIYSIAESLPSGWDQTSVVCTGSDGAEDPAALDLAPEETITCIFTNTKRGHIVVDKITNPASDPTSFDFTAGGSGYNNFSLTDAAAPNNQEVVPGKYSISESVPAGWAQISATCDSGETIDDVDVGPGETVTCTFTNGKLPTLELRKTVVTDNGGTAVANDFQAKIDGGDVAWSSPQTVSVGAHTASETTLPNYTASSWGTDCNADGTVDLDYGDAKVCTITNNDDPVSLTLIKHVINDNGGTETAGSWTLYADALNVTGSEAGAQVTDQAGTYDLSESTLAGYTNTSITCDDNPGVEVTSVTVGLGETKSCTFVNDDDAPSLILKKHVITDDGGVAVASDWTLYADALSVAGSEGGAPVTDQVGTYDLSESSLAGYTNTSITCDNAVSEVTSVTLGLGETVTCTFVNDDQPAYITVIKEVTNNNGGTAGPDDFNLTLAGAPVLSGAQTKVNPGTYTAGETLLPGYTFTGFSGDCDDAGATTVALGESKTCTLSNDDQQAYITVVKVVNDSYGGGALPDDFALTLSGDAVLSGVAIPVNPGTYTAAETLVSGYAFDGFSDQCDDSGSITVALGESKTCTLTNHDLPGSISGYKFEDVNANGVWDNGEPALANWQINLDGAATDSDLTDSNGYYEFTGLAKGIYAVTETQQPGWLQTTTDPAPINLANGATVTDVNFGNFALGEVHGIKFHDLDGDGAARENGEPLLADWTIRLYNANQNPWVLVGTDVTDSDGAYSFANLEPGTYKVCEVLQAGWIETFASSPAANSSPNAGEEGPQCQTINIDTSGETNGKNFGNYEAKDLTVSKTAATTYTRTFGWTIDKSVTPETLEMFKGDSSDVAYTVTVTKDEGEDSAWAATGTITITNPNPVATGLDATVTSVTDSMTGGINAAVNCPSDTVPAGGQLVCTYSANLPDGTDRTNTATVETGGIVGGGEGTAPVTFGAPSLLVNDTINVDDTNGSSWQFGDDGQVSYNRTFFCDRDQGEHDNTATIRETGQSDDASVTVNCYDVEVTKDATTTYTRTFDWDINKSVDQDALHLFQGDSGEVEYTVAVTKSAGTDSDFMVEGTITVTNNAPIAATINEVSDSMTGGLDAVVDCGGAGPYIVAADGGTLVCTYSRSLSDVTELTNTATAVLANSPSGTTDYTGTALVTFGEPDTLVNDTVDVQDLLDGSIEQINEEIAASKVYTYKHEYTCDLDEGAHTNVAKVIGDNDAVLDTDDATVTVNCYDLTVSKDANPSFTRTWTWTVDKTGSESNLNLAPGMEFPINYEVAVDASSVDSAHAVAGTITIVNPAPMSATVTVTDSMTGDIDATVVCPSDTVPAAGQLVCTYSTDLPNADARTNTATAALANGTQYTGNANVDFASATMTEVDEIADLTDSLHGDLGVLDARTDVPKTIPYTQNVGPYEVEQCGNTYQVDNTATVTPRDSGTDVEDTWSVNVNVQCVCSLTQGFWKTHNDSFKGGAPAYDGWLLLSPLAEEAGFFTSDPLTSEPTTGPNDPSLTWFDVFWTAPKGDAYYNLAHQYMAAKLNVLSGAYGPGVGDAIADAEALLSSIEPGDLVPPKGKNKKNWAYADERAEAIDLAGILGAFNEGETNPAGHCSEPPLAN